MYCSTGGEECTKEKVGVRDGYPLIGEHRVFAVEPLLQQAGVDIALFAHEHNYERLFPIFAGEVKKGSEEEPYTNPGAPIHIIAGAAGCRENHDGFEPEGQVPHYSAFRSEEYGYGKLQILNSTHVSWKQFSDTNGGVIDEVLIVKDHAAPHLQSHWMTSPLSSAHKEEERSKEAKRQMKTYERLYKCQERNAALPACAEGDFEIQ
jgi:hypothetical protein